MDLHDYLVILRTRWMSIVAVTAAGVALGVLGWLVLPASFTSEAAVFISVRDGATARDVLGGSSYANGQVQSFAEIARSQYVQQPAIASLHSRWTPNELGQTTIDVAVRPLTSVITIAATAVQPTQATAVAAAVADQLVQAVDKLSPTDSGGQRTIIATLITPAQERGRTGPQAAPLITVGLLLGLGLGFVQALVRGAIRPAPAHEPLT